MARLVTVVDCCAQGLERAVLKWLAWVVVVELVGLIHCVSLGDELRYRLVLESDCMEMRASEAFGGNADLELSCWVALQVMIGGDGATTGWNRFRTLAHPGRRTIRQCHTKCG